MKQRIYDTEEAAKKHGQYYRHLNRKSWFGVYKNGAGFSITFSKEKAKTLNMVSEMDYSLLSNIFGI